MSEPEYGKGPLFTKTSKGQNLALAIVCWPCSYIRWSMTSFRFPKDILSRCFGPLASTWTRFFPHLLESHCPDISPSLSLRLNSSFPESSFLSLSHPFHSLPRKRAWQVNVLTALVPQMSLLYPHTSLLSLLGLEFYIRNNFPFSIFNPIIFSKFPIIIERYFILIPGLIGVTYFILLFSFSSIFRNYTMKHFIVFCFHQCIRDSMEPFNIEMGIIYGNIFGIIFLVNYVQNYFPFQNSFQSGPP